VKRACHRLQRHRRMQRLLIPHPHAHFAPPPRRRLEAVPHEHLPPVRHTEVAQALRERKRADGGFDVVGAGSAALPSSSPHPLPRLVE
jgi:hypothetical protein